MELKKTNDENVLNFLKDNTQITTLSIGHGNLNFLNEVNGILPALKNLKLNELSEDYLNCECDPRFEKVENFTIESNHNSTYPEHIHFNYLQELTLNIQPEFNEKWIEFISQRMGLNIYRLTLQSAVLPNEQILTIAEKMSKLKTAKIVCQSQIPAHAITGLIEKCDQLHTLEVDAFMDEIEEQSLQDELHSEWDMHYSFFPGGRVKITIEKLDHYDSGAFTWNAYSAQVLSICLICIFSRGILVI